LCAAFLGFLPAATHFYLHSNFSSPSRVSADVSAANENLESAVAAVNERQSALSEAARAVRLDGAGVGGRRYCAPNAHARPCCLGFYGIYGGRSPNVGLAQVCVGSTEAVLRIACTYSVTIY
jgi:hypothetical protein